MGLFVCDKCHTIENTATGWFHCRRNNQRMLGEDYPDGMAMCSACAPAVFADGSGETGCGEWHDRFERSIASPEWIVREKEKSCIYIDTAGAIEVANGKEPIVKVNFRKR